MTQEDDIAAYAKRLYDRRTEGLMLKWADVSIGAWKPKPNQCHENGTTWCVNNPTYQPVRGWLYFDQLGMFLAHSAVRDPDGVLYDITPQVASQQYPFIIAEEQEDLYADLVERRGITELYS